MAFSLSSGRDSGGQCIVKVGPRSALRFDGVPREMAGSGAAMTGNETTPMPHPATGIRRPQYTRFFGGNTETSFVNVRIFTGR